MNLYSEEPIISHYSPISSKGGRRRTRKTRRTRKNIRSKNTRTRRRYH
jgi:hypothetical protein